MHVYRSSNEAAEIRESAVAIGAFDGIHLGHQALFRRTIELALEQHITAVVLTFQPHPARYFKPSLAPPLITTEEQRLKLIADQGVDAVVIEPFDRALAELSPEAFVRRILIEKLRARHVVVGTDFAFGRQRQGNLASLQRLGERLDFVAHGITPVCKGSIIASSTKIREFVLMGRVGGAAALLGRPFFIEGRVVTGAGRGRTIGIPTANLEPENELIPARGVYAGYAISDDEHAHDAVVNIGQAPTFSNEQCTRIEAHLLDYSGDLLWRRLRVVFIERLRDEQRFPSAEHLVEAIRQDIAKARQLLAARQ